MANLHFFKVQYETKKMLYKANVVAEHKDDLMNFIRATMGTEEGFKITNIDDAGIIHAFTDKVIGGIRGTSKPTVTEETKQVFVCPWCESTDYQSNHALKIHITKTHIPQTPAAKAKIAKSKKEASDGE